MSRTVAVAIVGCGRMGTERAVQLQRLGVHVAVFVDDVIENARSLAARFPTARVAASIDDVRLEGIAAIFVCTPPDDRRAPVRAAVRNGIALFVEKPIAVSLAEAAWMRDTVAAAGILAAVGYMNRYRRGAARARELASTSRVLGINCRWAGRRYGVAWWGQEGRSGGPINEQATHLVDLCRYIGGEIADVQARVADDGELAAAIFTFASGALGTLLYTCAAPEKDIGLQLFTTAGALHLDGWDLALTRDVLDSGGAVEADDPFATETRAFIDAVAANDRSPIRSDFNDAYATQRIVERIRTARVVPHESMIALT